MVYYTFLTRIVGYADGATDPIDFPIAPRFATDKLLKVETNNMGAINRSIEIGIQF